MTQLATAEPGLKFSSVSVSWVFFICYVTSYNIQRPKLLKTISKTVLSFKNRVFLYCLSWKGYIDKNHLKHISGQNPRTMSFTGRHEDSRTPPLNYWLGDALAKQFLLLKSRLTPLFWEHTDHKKTFFFFSAVPHGMWGNLRSLTGDWTHAPALELPSLHHRTTREVPQLSWKLK